MPHGIGNELMSDFGLHFLPTSGEWQFRALCANSNAAQHLALLGSMQSFVALCINGGSADLAAIVYASLGVCF